MAFPTKYINRITLADLIPSLWVSKINDFYKSNL